jgi:LacI family transcriptional regulator
MAVSRPGPRPRPTLSEVARLAGVSPSTASRVLRSDPRVAPGTRARVQRVADQLGMRINPLASSLRGGGRRPLVGVIVPDVSDSFFASLTLGVETEMLRVGRRIVLGCHHDSAAALAELFDGMLGEQLSAVIVVPAPGTSAGILIREARLGTPIVLADRPVPGFEADLVVCQNRPGAALLVDRLVSRGHRRLAVVGLDPAIWTQRERLQGIEVAMGRHGLAVPARWRASVVDGDEALRGTVAGWLCEPEPPTAIVSTSIRPLRPAIAAVRASGAAVEFGVFDYDPLFDLLDESVHVVMQSPVRVGATAAQMAIERLDGLDAPARRVELPVVPASRGVPTPVERRAV